MGTVLVSCEVRGGVFVFGDMCVLGRDCGDGSAVLLGPAPLAPVRETVGTVPTVSPLWSPLSCCCGLAGLGGRVGTVLAVGREGRDRPCCLAAVCSQSRARREGSGASPLSCVVLWGCACCCFWCGRRRCLVFGGVRRPPQGVWGPSEGVCGGVLLSRTLAGAVPSALVGLASGFGMGPGVSLPLWPPQRCGVFKPACGVVVPGPYSGRSRLLFASGVRLLAD